MLAEQGLDLREGWRDELTGSALQVDVVEDRACRVGGGRVTRPQQRQQQRECCVQPTLVHARREELQQLRHRRHRRPLRRMRRMLGAAAATGSPHARAAAIATTRRVAAAHTLVRCGERGGARVGELGLPATHDADREDLLSGAAPQLARPPGPHRGVAGGADLATHAAARGEAHLRHVHVRLPAVGAP